MNMHESPIQETAREMSDFRLLNNFFSNHKIGQVKSRHIMDAVYELYELSRYTDIGEDGEDAVSAYSDKEHELKGLLQHPSDVRIDEVEAIIREIKQCSELQS